MSLRCKKLINSIPDMVSEAVDGLLSLNPCLARSLIYVHLCRASSRFVSFQQTYVCAIYSAIHRLDGFDVIVHRDLATRKDQVAVISGGGSGHEPAHAGTLLKHNIRHTSLAQQVLFHVASQTILLTPLSI